MKDPVINEKIILSLNPCEDYYDFYKGKYERYEGKLSNILLLPDVRYNDKLWLAEHLLDLKTLQLWSTKCAYSVLHNYEQQYPNDNRIRHCIDKTKLYLDNKCSLEELKAAEEAAWSAESAIDSVAELASLTTISAVYSARAAVWSAACSAQSAVWAARSAAEAAALSAAQSARKEQENKTLSFLIELIKE